MRACAPNRVCPIGSATHLPASVRNLLGEPGGTSFLSHMSELRALSSLFPANHDPCKAIRKEPGQRIILADHSIGAKQRRAPTDRLFNLTVVKHCINLTSISPALVDSTRYTHTRSAETGGRLTLFIMCSIFTHGNHAPRGSGVNLESREAFFFFFGWKSCWSFKKTFLSKMCSLRPEPRTSKLLSARQSFSESVSQSPPLLSPLPMEKCSTSLQKSPPLTSSSHQ